MAHPWSHGCDDDSRPLWKELPQLGDGLLEEVDRPAQLAGPDPIQSFAGSSPRRVIAAAIWIG
jgi:hypothetical protein